VFPGGFNGVGQYNSTTRKSLAPKNQQPDISKLLNVNLSDIDIKVDSFDEEYSM